ncbi:DUF2177 family protein [uncultured Hydrogenophaga sp.]|uniref:DUF2177 family protein n=1 Tax=uncultured Hydrogenophaga sp. TaxID=199683 RepID=UPI00265F615B|nr:DUF2177 family protein [uncultured Hydrogenophaga sp.]
MNRFVAAYAGTATVMVILDLVWLGIIAKPLYQEGIGHLMAEQPLVPVAVVFYLLYALGVVVFAVAPQLAPAAPRGWVETLGMAALFGLIAYATYDLTNLATLKAWPWKLTIVDMAWGTVVTTVSAAGGKLALGWATRQ